jgi:hypothetical protein
MDSLFNYQQALSSFKQAKSEREREASEKLQEQREKTTEFTLPFETLGFESAGGLIKKSVKAIGKEGLRKAGITEERANRYIKAYNSSGTKGVMRELGKDKNELVKRVAGGVSPDVPDEPDVPKQNIADLLPKEFESQEGDIKSALKDEVKKLTGKQQQEFADKVSKRYVKDIDGEFAGDKNLANQYNLNQVQRTLEEVRGDKPGFSINSLTKSEYQDPDVGEILKGAVQDDIDRLEPAYRQKFNQLMNDRVATPSDIEDDVLRQKFNVHQASRTLDEIKTLTPDELTSANPVVSQATQAVAKAQTISQQLQSQTIRNVNQALDDDDDSSALLQGQKSVTNVFKNNLAKVTDQAKTIADDAKAGAKNLAKRTTEELGEKAGMEAGETVAETGGEADPIGDVIGAVVGLGTFLGGLFKADHLHQSSENIIRNTSYQLGA